MADEHNSRNIEHRWQLVVMLVTLAVLMTLVAFGVAKKEACSAAIGSVESRGSLYVPCDLVGLLVATSMVAAVGIAAVGLIGDRRTRMIAAAVAVVAVALVFIGGYVSLGLP
jgi:uncharacterized membrane protein YGL010W